MIVQASTLLAVLATVACADGNLQRPRPPDSTTDFFSNRHHTHPPIRTTTSPTPAHGYLLRRWPSDSTTDSSFRYRHHTQPPIKEATPSPPNAFVTRMDGPKSPETSPSNIHQTINAITSTQDTHSPTGTSPPTTVATTTTTEVPHAPVYGSYFTTDALSSSTIMNLPRNETISRVLFWPPSPNITVTLNISVEGWNYTFKSNTTLPKHWHSIDIYQPTSQSNKTMIYFNTDGRYITLNFSRVLHMQVGSDQTTHWCFCPRAHLCTLLSPLEHGGSDSSGQRKDLLVALFVVVFLLIVTLLALGGVTFYRKNELFHIYAKPIDCLPYTPQPPPLPRPNKESALHGHGGEEAKEVELTDNSGYSRVSGGTSTAVPPTPVADNATHSKPCEKPKEHESINCLYGLV